MHIFIEHVVYPGVCSTKTHKGWPAQSLRNKQEISVKYHNGLQQGSRCCAGSGGRAVIREAFLEEVASNEK